MTRITSSTPPSVPGIRVVFITKNGMEQSLYFECSPLAACLFYNKPKIILDIMPTVAQAVYEIIKPDIKEAAPLRPFDIYSIELPLTVFDKIRFATFVLEDPFDQIGVLKKELELIAGAIKRIREDFHIMDDSSHISCTIHWCHPTLRINDVTVKG